MEQTFDELIGRCLVQVGTPEQGDRFGTGFFVADQTVMTCAHVVHGMETVKIVWQGQELDGNVVTQIPAERKDSQYGYYPLPDIAVVKLAKRVDHPSVWLADHDEWLIDRSLVTVHGFSRETPRKPEIARDVCQLTVGGLLEDDCVRVIDDRIPKGMSGSLVLDANTRRVCGFVKASVDHSGVQPAGGWIVSVAALARHVPEVVKANKWACAAWRDAADPGYRYLAKLFAKDTPPVITKESERPPSYYLDPRRRIAQFLPRKELNELID